MIVIAPTPTRRGLFVLIAAIAISFGSAHADEVRLFSGGAPQVVLRTFTAEFEKSSGHKITPTFALVTGIQQKLLAGEKADLVLLPVPLIGEIAKSVPMRTEGRGVLARVRIAVIVREGAVKPDVSSPDAIRKLLIEARSVAFPEPTTPGGAHLNRMIEQLGVADTVRPKLLVKAAIAGGGELVADGKADVGMYLLSESQSIKGIVVAGLLPEPVQSYVVYGSAVPASNDRPEAALSYLRFMSAPEKQANWTASGFELVTLRN
jgi:molybdate transport system substrate-binding protein